ncbi:hypothetical protein [Plebeiibacterium sediminum]|uniref:Glycosyltransferase family 1 protein n=1 Tax=Plebeiibacterium sediminum TaxID=2992112 RepID=A0AAE3M3C1_9BACT|nr:hypothetical protein [Plebeiobacterium sediminum]MCW3786231.1 hypothetical protein [Plebeiobacterium sediminum]
MKCELYLNSINRHLQQVYTGFSELNQKGVFSSFKVFINKRKDLKHNQTLMAIVNGVKIIYDVRDDYNIPEEYFDFEFDFYFKRDCSRQYFKDLDISEKIFPLGFNYLVTSDQNFGLEFKYIIKFPGMLKYILKHTFISSWMNDFKWDVCNFNNIERMPLFLSDPKILFLTRTWNPEEISESKEKKDERRYINDTRAKCIDLCRREFGDIFLGGFANSEYSDKFYKEYCVNNSKIVSKEGYFKVLDESSICVSTMGLHKSIGWKMGEYVAKSKAIVSEEFISELPGDFKKNQNYLEFREPNELIENIQRLIDNPSIRESMMLNNWLYYQQNLRPDMLVYNTLYKVFND